MSKSLNNSIEKLGQQLNESGILIGQLHDDVARNLSWLEGNVTENLTNQLQIEIKRMNDAYQFKFQNLQDMLVQVQCTYIFHRLSCNVYVYYQCECIKSI